MRFIDTCLERTELKSISKNSGASNSRIRECDKREYQLCKSLKNTYSVNSFHSKELNLNTNVKKISDFFFINQKLFVLNFLFMRIKKSLSETREY
jgi:hypothetical protein